MTKDNKSIWLVLGWCIVGVRLIQSRLGKGWFMVWIESPGGGCKAGFVGVFPAERDCQELGFFDLAKGDEAGKRMDTVFGKTRGRVVMAGGSR
jgi:hypothetical protein